MSSPKTYRTLIHGTLVQESALCVGGSVQEGSTDLVCARDGDGRLIIPGSGFAGALVETAGRIFPRLFADTKLNKGERTDVDSGSERKPHAEIDEKDIEARERERREYEAYRRITGKVDGAPQRGSAEDDPFLQSAWLFRASHRCRDYATEARQGVGIRQATGATAIQKGALFDMETVPVGTTWDFMMEIDTFRGGQTVEYIALLALQEWTQGRCWLGAAAARGLGWMELKDVQVLRLPMTIEAIEAWPDNTVAEGWDALVEHLEQGGLAARPMALRDVLAEEHGTERRGHPLGLGDKRFWYLTIDAEVSAGDYTPEGGSEAYGLDAISVGGHAAHELTPLADPALAPLGMNEEKRGELTSAQDAPVGTTDHGRLEPFLPGSGVRGPIRHTASRWYGGKSKPIADPNDPGRDTEAPPDKEDSVGQLFGLESQAGRLLVRDAALVEPDGKDAHKNRVSEFELALLQHHAEDEFTAGVYSTAKFDRTVVTKGTFGVRLIIEAKKSEDLRSHVETLKPALRLAELGHLPIGGGKWRGLGWGRWRFKSVKLCRAGETGEAEKTCETKVEDEAKIVAMLKTAIDGLPESQDGGQT